MNKTKYHAILDSLAKWCLSTTDIEDGRGRKPNSGKKRGPGNPYPVVLELLNKKYPCEFCEEICTKPKQYTRTPKGKTWTVKCLDCGLREEVSFDRLIGFDQFLPETRKEE